ncbi:MAG: rod shape-determining protein, partial [Candidatus Dormibacteraceae bacterium]
FERRFSLRLESRAAEQVKRAVGAALPLAQPLTTEVLVTDLDGDGQTRRRVTSGDVAEAVAGSLERVVGWLRLAIDRVPVSHRVTIAEQGLVLVGGGAQLRDLDRFLAERLEVRVRLAPEPGTCVVRGSVLALETMRVFHAHHLYLR